MATNDKKMHKKVLKEVMKELYDISFNKTPPEVSTLVHRKIKEITNCKDPYDEVKKKKNLSALKIESKLKYWIKNAENKLFSALKFSIAGNVIDFGRPKKIDITKILREIDKKDLVINDFNIFKKKLSNAKDILYIGGNAGEIIFDKLLISELLKMGKNVKFVVSEKPIINDATIEDAKFVGLDKIVKVITGIKESPGTVLELCSEDFIKEFRNSDMIIAKGQGNYEALSNENANIFFLLVPKCKIVAEDLGVNIEDFVLKYGGEK